MELGSADQPALAWTTLAVLPALKARVPEDSPVAVDTAAAWFAPGNAARQQELANLAALAGVGWVRDRLRWNDIQPKEGELRPPPTTYDTSAEAHHAAGLGVLQVFHDTPTWARSNSNGGGRFPADLRTVYDLGQRLAVRFKGRVGAWEPWNEANVATFGAHTVDQMCSWQKAAWLGLKAGDPNVIVGWNATAAVPTPAHTEGILANETWPYFDTYNIHTYDWSHSYPELWRPAREAASGRPLWITEADRGTPHLKNPPWFDQAPRLERLKAEWIAQSYASSLFSGASRHFHFILGHYQEPNGVQFGLLRLDLTPRPAYVALAAVGRCLAGAKSLGRWQPAPDVHIHAFHAQPDGEDRDVLVAWTEREVDWDGRGTNVSMWTLPENLKVLSVTDYLGRSIGRAFPKPLTSAPVFVFLPPGQAASLPLEPPPARAARREGIASPVVLQITVLQDAVKRVEDLPWSEGYVYKAKPGQTLRFGLNAYNFSNRDVEGMLRVVRCPESWNVKLERDRFQASPMARSALQGTVFVPETGGPKDGWVVIESVGGPEGHAVVAFRTVVGE